MTKNGPMPVPSAPEGYNTVNSFIITAEAHAMIGFLESVFGAREVREARTLDDDGLILHSELKIGDSVVMVADRKPDWPFTPSLLQVYVDDLTVALQRSIGLGGAVVTEPTDFYGTMFARVLDPWQNLWWIWQHGAATSWENRAEEAGLASDEDHEGWNQDSPGLTYIHDTLLKTLSELGR